MPDQTGGRLVLSLSLRTCLFIGTHAAVVLAILWFV